MITNLPESPEAAFDFDAAWATLRRSNAASRLRTRLLKVHACLFEPRAVLTAAREAQVRRICNRLAERIDAVNPWPGLRMPRFD